MLATAAVAALILEHVELQHASSQAANAIHSLRAIQAMRSENPEDSICWLRSSLALNIDQLREWSEDSQPSEVAALEQEVIGSVLREIASYDAEEPLFSRERESPELLAFIEEHAPSPASPDRL